MVRTSLFYEALSRGNPKHLLTSFICRSPIGCVINDLDFGRSCLCFNDDSGDTGLIDAPLIANTALAAKNSSETDSH